MLRLKISGDYAMMRDGREWSRGMIYMRGNNFSKDARRFKVNRIDITVKGSVLVEGFFPDLRAIYGTPCRTCLFIGKEDDVLVIHETVASRRRNRKRVPQ